MGVERAACRPSVTVLIITLHAKLSGAVYCNRSCLRVCGFVCLFVHASIDRHQTGFIGKGSGISSWLNFGRPAPPGMGLPRGEIFAYALLQPARSVCVYLSAFFMLPVPLGRLRISCERTSRSTAKCTATSHSLLGSSNSPAAGSYSWPQYTFQYFCIYSFIHSFKLSWLTSLYQFTVYHSEFLQAGCLTCRSTNSVRPRKA